MLDHAADCLSTFCQVTCHDIPDSNYKQAFAKLPASEIPTWGSTSYVQRRAGFTLDIWTVLGVTTTQLLRPGDHFVWLDADVILEAGKYLTSSAICRLALPMGIWYMACTATLVKHPY